MRTLFYYYKKTLKPFRSIMELSDVEMNEFMRANLPEESVFHTNPQRYIKRRRETESWLHKAFISSGGEPQTIYPIYMTLGRASYIESQGIYTEYLQLPLSLFSEKSISFTYPDSFVSRWLAETNNEHFNPENHGQIFTIVDLPRLLSTETAHNDAWKITERKYDFFIEAQIWNTDPLHRFLAETR
jgi:hypothetical protein